MSPIFQTTSRSNSVGGLKTSGGRNNIYLNDKGQTQQEVMKLAKEDYLAADESKKDERYDNFVDKADSITKVNLTPPKNNNMGSALYQKFVGKKEDTDTRVNWNDDPIPEGDKKTHPKFKLAMQRIDKFSGMKDSPEKTEFFRDSIETPSIKYNNKSYSLQSLIPD